jgi:excisionase family DNA binding protein
MKSAAKMPKNQTVNEVCGETNAQPTSNLQLLTFQEVADYLKVSLRTVRRLVESGELPCIYIRSSPRIRGADVEQYLHEAIQPQISTDRVGLDVRSNFGAKRTCQNATIKTASTKGRNQNSGGQPTSTGAARELAVRLGLTTEKKQKPC